MFGVQSCSRMKYFIAKVKIYSWTDTSRTNIPFPIRVRKLDRASLYLVFPQQIISYHNAKTVFSLKKNLIWRNKKTCERQYLVVPAPGDIHCLFHAFPVCADVFSAHNEGNNALRGRQHVGLQGLEKVISTYCT